MRRLRFERLEYRLPFALANVTDGFGDMDIAYANEGVSDHPSFAQVKSNAIPSFSFVTPSGQIYVFGDNYGLSKTTPAIARFNADGSVDETFGDNGRLFFFDGDYFKDVQQTGDGFLLTVQVEYETTTRDYVYKIFLDGRLDRSFGQHGRLPIAFDSFASSPTNGHVYQTEVLSDGRFLIAIEKDLGLALHRYSAKGELDGSFGSSGSIGLPFESKFDIDATDRIYVLKRLGGSSTSFRYELDRFSVNGIREPFGSTVTLDLNRSVEIDADTNLVIAAFGSATGNISVVKLNLEGQPISTFGTNGVVTNTIGSSYRTAFNLFRLENDRLMIAQGYETGGADVLRVMTLLPTGAIGESLGQPGVQSLMMIGDLTPTNTNLLKDGSLVVVGDSELPNGEYGMGFVRITNAGQVIGTASMDAFEADFASEFSDIQYFDRFNLGSSRSISIVDSMWIESDLNTSNAALPQSLSATGQLLANEPFSIDSFVTLYSTRTLPSSNPRFFLRRNLRDSSAGTTLFGLNGVVELPYFDVQDIQVLNGQIYVLGARSSSQTFVARYLNSGELDITYGVAGVFEVDGASVNSNLTLDSFGNAYFVANTGQLELVAIDSHGRSMRNNIVLNEINLPGSFGQLTVVSDFESNLVIAGPINMFDSGNSMFMTRVLKSRSLDTAFGNQGLLVLADRTLPPSVDRYLDLLDVQPDRITFVSQKSGYTHLTQVNSLLMNPQTNRFEFDGGFGDRGVTSIELDRHMNPVAFDRMPDGSYLLSLHTKHGTGSQGTVVRLLGPKPFHNRMNPLNAIPETQGPDSINPLDVLTVVNAINSGKIEQNSFPDVDGDGAVTPLDVLTLVNFLNNRPGGGEGEGSADQLFSKVQDFWLGDEEWDSNYKTRRWRR
jgi:uncharacterized delta-60 repeat protein